ncbi:flagellin-like protein [Pseudomaricurvus alkylphenolicus]|jgi:flagellin|uniref:flagellin N-terminal helical domain-containing protein n=1 Tax=Pseudomaricurvus alkylphenolicus TaxID=1306991 RepID=UPI00141E1475|nr:flagellin [Pseudomaricurvus alkylphenolicus]NIB40275.1 flagellin-like protein [Pseudomaricurvus alkylphenolicus]
MAITLNTGNFFASIQQAQRASETSASRLASGLRINSAADDAAGLAISNRLGAQTIGFNQAVRNANDGISLIQTADGSLGSITENLQRFRELAIQAGSGILNDSDRAAINAEALQLRDEINRILETSSFNGVDLFKNTGSVDLQIGGNSGETLSVDTQNLLQQVNDLGLNSIDLSSSGGAQSALGVLDSIQGLVNENASNLGAINNRLDNTISQLQGSAVNAEASRSRIADTDFARESSEKARNDILLEAGLALQAQANIRSELVLQLLNP